MGFFVPGSISSEYVASKTDENEITPMYEKQSSDISLQKQAALQQLDKTYSQTIDNAYSSYLAANKGLNASLMGQGYKELYRQIQDQQLLSKVSGITSDVASQRASLAQQEASAQSQIQQAFEKEVSYFDKIQQSFADYYEYAKKLTTDGNNYFSEYGLNRNVDEMYDVLGNLQLAGYKDEDENEALSYSQWVKQNLAGKDSDWYKWFLTTGYNEFMNAPKSSTQARLDVVSREALEAMKSKSSSHSGGHFAKQQQREENDKELKEAKAKTEAEYAAQFKATSERYEQQMAELKAKQAASGKSHRSSSSGSHGYNNI